MTSTDFERAFEQVGTELLVPLGYEYDEPMGRFCRLIGENGGTSVLLEVALPRQDGRGLEGIVEPWTASAMLHGCPVPLDLAVNFEHQSHATRDVIARGVKDAATLHSAIATDMKSFRDAVASIASYKDIGQLARTPEHHLGLAIAGWHHKDRARYEEELSRFLALRELTELPADAIAILSHVGILSAPDEEAEPAERARQQRVRKRIKLDFSDFYFLGVPARVKQPAIVKAAVEAFRSIKSRPEEVFLAVMADTAVKQRRWFHFHVSSDWEWPTELLAKRFAKLLPDLLVCGEIDDMSYQEFAHYKAGRLALCMQHLSDSSTFLQGKKALRADSGESPWLGQLGPAAVHKLRHPIELGLALLAPEDRRSRFRSSHVVEMFHIVAEGRVLPKPPVADPDLDELIDVPND